MNFYGDPESTRSGRVAGALRVSGSPRGMAFMNRLTSRRVLALFLEWVGAAAEPSAAADGSRGVRSPADGLARPLDER